MKTNQVLFRVAVVLCALGGLTLAALQAAPVDRFGPGSHGLLRERIAEELGLTVEQRETIRSEIRSEKETILFLARSLLEAKKECRHVLHQPDATEEMVRAAAAKVGEVQVAIAVERFKIYQRIRPVLLPEQLDTIKAWEAKGGRLVDRLLERWGQRLEQ